MWIPRFRMMVFLPLWMWLVILPFWVILWTAIVVPQLILRGIAWAIIGIARLAKRQPKQNWEQQLFPVTEDGHWQWDGERWRPRVVPPPAATASSESR